MYNNNIRTPKLSKYILQKPLKMSLSENEVIASLMKNANYIEQITNEMIPDDTLDLLKGTRKGKSDVKTLDHIVGVSDLQSL